MLKRLFEKAYIGNLELRNRIVMTAVHLGYADDAGFITERMVRFYEERAKGGVGLIIVGVCYTEPQGKHFPMQIGIDRDEVIFNLRELTGSIQKHGAKVCCQIGHGGRYDHPDISGAHPVAPSPIPAPIFTRGITPKELTIAEIQRIIDNFGVASRRVKEAGFDGVEIAASGGALISQFLSPVTNKRTDRYGGDLKNRLTFLLEIIKAIRGKVGKDYPLLVRICGHDMVSGSHTLKEQKTVAQEIEKAGADCINVNIGWEESPHPMLQMYVPRGAFVFLSNGIRSVVRIPVIGGIRVNDPLLAETILKEEKADLVTMCRPLIADPELPRKAMEGRLEDIRMCIGCNQRCLDNALTSVGVTCLVNVQAGREREFAIEPAPRSKKVLVIGGGPAGLEAARIAAIRGHEVKIIEKADKLGGKLNIGSIPPGKGELMLIPRYYSTLLPKLGVKVHLETEVTPKLIKDEKPEVVVVATGATPSTTKIPGVEGNNVITAEDALLEKVSFGQNIVILGGGAAGCETAHFFAKKGATSPDAAIMLATEGILPCDEAIALTQGTKSVTIVEMLSKAGRGICANMRYPLMKDLRRHRVNILTNAKVEEITSEGVIYTKNGKKEVLKADTVVNALGYKPNKALFEKLEGKVPELYLIGDSKEPRCAIEAIEEGFLTGRQI